MQRKPQKSQVVLTDRQRKVYNYIQNCILEKGYSPTFREIRTYMGFSENSVSGATCHIDALKKKGLITVDPGKARGIRLTDHDKRVVPKLPLLPRDSEELEEVEFDHLFEKGNYAEKVSEDQYMIRSQTGEQVGAVILINPISKNP